ncbi:hypothetical protein BHE74_00020344 [Ensete ventricosum]|nr:hypothetical protein BHE74_00020344 [Ensete ventricosum]
MEEIADHSFTSASSSSVDGQATVAGPYSSMAAPPPPPPPSPPATGASAVGRFYDDDDEEGDVCRICRNPGDADNPLRYPCACSGSIKFVHQDCLLQWLNHSNARQCEVCKHTFSFSPVYAENAPTRLPFEEFVVGMAMKACHVLQFFLRLAFVLSVWLLMIPFITFWIWRLTFVRSLSEAQRLFFSHMSAPVILTDCLHGFLLSASIVFIFLGATSLRDYFRHLRELGGHDAERDDEGQERNGARAVRRLPGPVNRIPAGDENAEDAGGAQGIAGAGQIIRRNAENVAARLELQAARLEAHVEQMFDGLDDADGAEDVPFDELVGMQGPVFHLVENAITMPVADCFLPVTTRNRSATVDVDRRWPISGGISRGRKKKREKKRENLEIWLCSPDPRPWTSRRYRGEKKMMFLLPAQASRGEDVFSLRVGRRNVSPCRERERADLLKGTVIGSSHLSDVTTLAVGYMFIFCFIFFYFGLLALIRYSRGGAGQNDQPLVPRIAAEDHQGRVDIVGNADAAEESDVDDPADSE